MQTNNGYGHGMKKAWTFKKADTSDGSTQICQKTQAIFKGNQLFEKQKSRQSIKEAQRN